MKTLMVILALAGTLALAPLSPRERDGVRGGAPSGEIPSPSIDHRLAADPSPQPSPVGRGGKDEPVVFDQDAMPTFATLDLTIDPKGQALGAYQVELTSADTTFAVVGVEGVADGGAFDHGRPPYFDPVAQQGETDKLILAEYARPELGADALPTQPVRIATVHLMLAGPIDEQAIQLTLTAAGNAEGDRIDADISYQFRTPERPE